MTSSTPHATILPLPWWERVGVRGAARKRRNVPREQVVEHVSRDAPSPALQRGLSHQGRGLGVGRRSDFLGGVDA
jgi:hypothetical protein